jgi:hypothetical protein
MSALIPPRSTRVHGDEAAVTIERLIALIDELLAVIAEENQVLARGLPASLSTQTARKHELADRFELWVKDVAARPIRIASCDQDLQQALMDRIARLRAGMDENMDRLRAAMEASRRRIETVMQAIRSEIASASPYGPNGQVRDKRSGGSFCNLSVRA